MCSIINPMCASTFFQGKLPMLNLKIEYSKSYILLRNFWNDKPPILQLDSVKPATHVHTSNHCFHQHRRHRYGRIDYENYRYLSKVSDKYIPLNLLPKWGWRTELKTPKEEKINKDWYPTERMSIWLIQIAVPETCWLASCH